MACNNCYQKSTLSASTATSSTVAAAALVPFNTVNLHTGASISFSAGNSSINIVKPGLYEVTFDASVSVTAATAATLSFQINRAGVAITGATASYTSSATTDIGSVSITTLVRVSEICPCASNGANSIAITVSNISTVAALMANANITVVKLA